MELLGLARFVQGWGNGSWSSRPCWRSSGVSFPIIATPPIAAYVLRLYFGRIVAPSVSATLINLPSWRTIFYFNVPIAALAVVLTFHLLQEDHPREKSRASFDFEGLVLLLGWVLCLMLGLFRFQKWGWSNSNEFWMVTAAGLHPVRLVHHPRIPQSSSFARSSPSSRSLGSP